MVRVTTVIRRSYEKRNGKNGGKSIALRKIAQAYVLLNLVILVMALAAEVYLCLASSHLGDSGSTKYMGRKAAQQPVTNHSTVRMLGIRYTIRPSSTVPRAQNRPPDRA